MKKIPMMILAAALALALSGCAVEKAQSAQGAQSAKDTQSGQPTDDASAKTDGAAVASAQTVESAASDQPTIELTETMYVTYINEIYTNYDDYIGRTVKLEGMYTSEYYEPSDATYYYVYRVGPGCCGNDGSMCGFEFTWDGEMPKDNDWIEVVGTLNKYDLDGQTYLTIKASSVTVKTERGAENVYR